MIRYRRANKKIGDALQWDVEQVCQWLRDEPESGGGGMPQLCKVRTAGDGTQLCVCRSPLSNESLVPFDGHVHLVHIS